MYQESCLEKHGVVGVCFRSASAHLELIPHGFCFCFSSSLAFLTKLERLDLGCNELEELVNDIYKWFEFSGHFGQIEKAQCLYV